MVTVHFSKSRLSLSIFLTWQSTHCRHIQFKILRWKILRYKIWRHKNSLFWPNFNQISKFQPNSRDQHREHLHCLSADSIKILVIFSIMFSSILLFRIFILTVREPQASTPWTTSPKLWWPLFLLVHPYLHWQTLKLKLSIRVLFCLAKLAKLFTTTG